MSEGCATDATLGHWDRLLLYGTVATTGAAVMMLELLGTRIIGPFYGVSLYVWSSLISVVLIALFQHRRTRISRPGQNFFDFVFLASHQPISLAPDNEHPLYNT